jgi:hypothetical protein
LERVKPLNATQYNMAALVFPPTPTVGQRFPINPGTAGVSQWEYDGGKWNTVLNTLSLGTTNQDAYNAYQWPNADGVANRQLTTDGAGNLTWEIAATPNLQVLGLLEPIDGAAVAYTLVLGGTTTPFAPNPSTNIVVFLGGVPQVPVASYTVSTNTITFTEAPKIGSTFYAISSVVA